MARVQIWGFRCERCEHEWAPREPDQAPTVCPKCKSPYWNRPRKDDVKPEHRVTCKWKVANLDRKTVEFELRRDGKTLRGAGRFSATDLGNGYLQIEIKIPRAEGDEITVKLVQAEVDRIESHTGQYRFRLQP